jgi:hypothetical protein
MNTVYNKIVDISEERDFSITVGWGSNEAGLLVENSLIEGASAPFREGLIATKRTFYDNGVLSVYVLNNLVTSGTSTSPVHLFVSSHSNDMEFWGPDGDTIPHITYAPQSGIEEEVIDCPDEAAMTDKVAGTHEDNVFRILAGERVSSFRTLLKRYQFYRTVGATINSVTPDTFFKGTWSTKLDSRTDKTPLLTDMTTTLDYVSRCFCGQRGAIRYRYLPLFGSLPYVVRARRGNFTTTAATIAEHTCSAFGLGTYATADSLVGTAMSNPVSGNVLEVECPYYCWFRFDPVVSSNSANTAYDMSLAMEVYAPRGKGGVENVNFQFAGAEYISTGEDYNVFYFLGAAPMWFV